MSAGAINFQVAKQVPIVRILAHYGVQLHATGGELRGQCPLPEHTSRESHNSFSVNTARNVWCCQSQSCIHARDGELGGTVLDLVARMERCSVREAAVKLTEWFGAGEVAPVRVQAPSASQIEPSAPFSTQRTRSLQFVPGEPRHHAIDGEDAGNRILQRPRHHAGSRRNSSAQR